MPSSDAPGTGTAGSEIVGSRGSSATRRSTALVNPLTRSPTRSRASATLVVDRRMRRESDRAGEAGRRRGAARRATGATTDPRPRGMKRREHACREVATAAERRRRVRGRGGDRHRGAAGEFATERDVEWHAAANGGEDGQRRAAWSEARRRSVEHSGRRDSMAPRLRAAACARRDMRRARPRPPSRIAVAMPTGSRRFGQCGVHQDAVDALFHHQAGVRGGADAGVDDDRHAEPRLDGADEIGIEQPSPEPIGDASGMTATAPAASRRSAVIRSSLV